MRGRFLVGTGPIASVTENPGGPHDIVITDAQHSLLLLAASSGYLFPIESVHAVVEVRSGPGLEVADLGTSFARLRALRPEPGLARFSPLQTECDLGRTEPAVHTAFGYRGPMDPAGLIEDVRVANEQKTQNGGRCVIDYILVVSATYSADLTTGYVVGYSRTEPGIGRFFQHLYYPIQGEPGLQGPSVLHQGEDSFA